MTEMTLPSVTLESDGAEPQYIANAGDLRIVLDHNRGIGPRSVEFLMLSLGSCTIGTLMNHMRSKGLPTTSLRVELTASPHPTENRYARIEMQLQFDPSINAEQHKTLLAVARTCRIHRTLERHPEVSIQLKKS